MSKPLGFTSLLLISTAFVAPSILSAQTVPVTPPADAAPQSPEAVEPVVEEPVEEPVEVSIPGGGGGDAIIVTGRRESNITKAAPQVVSILSSADIARTGEGDIAGALSRVTGLSVVGNGFVYVRGLGDRYSLALLNGSPLSSPEPLKRVVPLDLFPTSIIASSLVQKSYSVNFPGEFGGGVINLTTKAIPKESFLSVGGSISGDSETTNQLGYTYFGSSIDPTGFTNANRNTPPALASFLASGVRVDELSLANNKAITAQLFNGRNSVIQRDNKVLPNGSTSISGGAVFDIGEDRLGFIATLGYSNKWRTRDTLQQTASSADLSSTDLNFQRVITDNRIVVNGLLGIGYEFGDNKLRLTNLYIRDTLKQTRLGEGTRSGQSATFQQQSTVWFERQLIDSHFVGEFRLTPELSLDVRGGYANAQREAPNEYTFEYFRSNIPVAEDPFGEQFINRLNNGQQGSAAASFSDLNEDLWSAGVDLAYKITPTITASVGYAFSDTKRRSERRSFLVVAPNTLPLGVALLRPDLLLQPDVVNAFDIALVDSDPGNPVFIGKLRNHAGYAQVQASIASGVSLNAGVRYETAKQSVIPVQVFTNAVASTASTNLDRNYWLPAATLTLDVADKMQVRFNASKTIARPQFRELIFQPFFDPDSNRSFRGNPNLRDSQLINAEARYEWYFARDQRFSAAAFYKKIDNPIESFSSVSDNNIITSFANAPQATLYGVEIETQKYFGLSSISDSSLFSSRRAVVIANYTFTKSRLKVGADDPVSVFSLNSTRATDFFTDGAPLTGQSDHLVNLQLGLEDTNGLSQQTILVTYASKRVTSRASSALQPDLIEKPGFRIDFVARQGVKIFGTEAEVNFEARNLTQTKYQELQENGTNQVFYNRYDVGTTFELGINLKF